VTMSATAAETSTLSPTFRGQHELETEGAENSDEGLLGMGYIVYIAAAILVGAVLVVVGVVSTRLVPRPGGVSVCVSVGGGS
jgi:hypothetical protein